ncbi:MAG TPA: uroporphyrinogen decarboxylase family protein [Actinomycetota bacterium]|jgi:uroporphyrinogen decarboxylase|nr:uroporphyrinogen decarboxylase family protein [Actinomycetota bacterium]
MDPIDRVRAALALQRPDRPPAAWWGHTYRQEWSAVELAEVTAARQRSYGWDFVKLQPRACCFAQAWGAEYLPHPRFEQAPVQLHRVVSSPEGWSSVRPIDPGAPALQEQVEALRLVVRELGPAIPVIQTIFSPLTVAGYLRGEDKPLAARELREHPDAVTPALAGIAGTLATFAARSLEAGAAGIFFAISGYASTDLLGPEEYRALALPHDRRVLEAAGGAWFNVLHLCGPRLHFPVASALATAAVNWSVHEPGNPSLAEGRTLMGRAVMGGVDHDGTMLEGSAREVADQVRAAVEGTGGTGVLVAPGCSVPPVAPEANLRAVTAPPA